MSAKRHHLGKKSAGHKKIVNAFAIQPDEEASFHNPPERGSKESIERQFHRIQRGYSLLMTEVVKEFDLVKLWLEKEANDRSHELKEKISSFGMPKF